MTRSSAHKSTQLTPEIAMIDISVLGRGPDWAGRIPEQPLIRCAGSLPFRSVGSPLLDVQAAT